MPFNVLLLPLLGGFVLVTRWNYTRFKSKRFSGERLILLAAIAGVFLLIGGFIGVQLLVSASPALQSAWQRHVPFAYAGTSFLAFMIGLVAWKPLNWWSPRERAARAAVTETNDFLEMLLDDAITNTLIVALSLKSGKVYIGFVSSNFDPAYVRRYVRLWPILSGYRNKDTHELAITTNYANAYSTLVTDNADVDRFQVIVPIGEVQSASSFDPSAYAVFNPLAEPLMT